MCSSQCLVHKLDNDNDWAGRANWLPIPDSSGITQQVQQHQIRPRIRDRHHLSHHHPTQNAVLYGESHFAHVAHLVSLHFGKAFFSSLNRRLRMTSDVLFCKWKTYCLVLKIHFSCFSNRYFTSRLTQVKMKALSLCFYLKKKLFNWIVTLFGCFQNTNFAFPIIANLSLTHWNVCTLFFHLTWTQAKRWP